MICYTTTANYTYLAEVYFEVTKDVWRQIEWGRYREWAKKIKVGHSGCAK